MNVLLLGAGASLGARADENPLVQQILPPLGNQLASYLLNWMRANDPAQRLRQVVDGYQETFDHDLHHMNIDLWNAREDLSKIQRSLFTIAQQQTSSNPGRTSFEVLMDSEEFRPLLHTTQKLITLSMTAGRHCAFEDHPDRMDELITRMRPELVITANYDLLLENALDRNAISFDYPGLHGRTQGAESIKNLTHASGTPVGVFKLHGSIGWHSLYNGAVSATLQVAERIAHDRPTTLRLSGPHAAADTWATSEERNRRNLVLTLENSSVIGAPVIAVYGSGKYVLDNPSDIENHRATCLSRILGGSLDRVVAIGLRPPSEDDDPILFQTINLLGKLAKERIYIAPSDDDCAEFRKRGFEATGETMARFLERIGQQYRQPET
jgi:hypothetical protein